MNYRDIENQNYRILTNAAKSEDEELYVVSDSNKFTISLFQKAEKEDYNFERKLIYFYLAVLLISVVDSEIFGFNLFLGLPLLIIGIYLLSKYRRANETIIPMQERKIETYQSFSIVYNSELSRTNKFVENSFRITMLVFFKPSEDFDIQKLWKEDYHIDNN